MVSLIKIIRFRWHIPIIILSLLTLSGCKAGESTDDGAIDLSLSDLHGGEGTTSDGEAGIPLSSCPLEGWTEMSSGTTHDLLSIWGSGADDIFAVGAAGTILHFNGASWLPMTVPAGSSSRELRSVWGSSDLGVLVVGSSGTILHYDGLAWRELSALPPTATIGFNAVCFHGDRAVAAGTSADPDVSSLFAFDGLTWRSMADQGAPLGVTINGLWSDGEQELIAVGSGAASIHRHDGQRWLPMILPSSVEVGTLQAVWGPGPESVYAVGRQGVSDRGVILHFNGAYWSAMHTPDLTTERRYTAIWGSGAEEIFVVAAGLTAGSVIRQSDGTSWRELSLPSRIQRHYINRLWGPDPGQLFAVGNDGAILRWCRPTDG